VAITFAQGDEFDHQTPEGSPTEPIVGFESKSRPLPGVGDVSLLSNFTKMPKGQFIDHGGIEWPTVEHAFQAAKIDRNDPRAPEYMARLLAAPTGAAAKAIGSERAEKGRGGLPLRRDWSTVKYGIMEQLIQQRVEKDTRVQDILVASGNRPLVHTSSGDRADLDWGADTSRNVGANNLGQLYAIARTRLLTGRNEAFLPTITGTRQEPVKLNLFQPGMEGVEQIPAREINWTPQLSIRESGHAPLTPQTPVRPYQSAWDLSVEQNKRERANARAGMTSSPERSYTKHLWNSQDPQRFNPTQIGSLVQEEAPLSSVADRLVPEVPFASARSQSISDAWSSSISRVVNGEKVKVPYSPWVPLTRLTRDKDGNDIEVPWTQFKMSAGQLGESISRRSEEARAKGLVGSDTRIAERHDAINTTFGFRTNAEGAAEPIVPRPRQPGSVPVKKGAPQEAGLRTPFWNGFWKSDFGKAAGASPPVNPVPTSPRKAAIDKVLLDMRRISNPPKQIRGYTSREAAQPTKTMWGNLADFTPNDQLQQQMLMTGTLSGVWGSRRAQQMVENDPDYRARAESMMSTIQVDRGMRDIRQKDGKVIKGRAYREVPTHITAAAYSATAAEMRLDIESAKTKGAYRAHVNLGWSFPLAGAFGNQSNRDAEAIVHATMAAERDHDHAALVAAYGDVEAAKLKHNIDRTYEVRELRFDMPNIKQKHDPDTKKKLDRLRDKPTRDLLRDWTYLAARGELPTGTPDTGSVIPEGAKPYLQPFFQCAGITHAQLNAAQTGSSYTIKDLLGQAEKFPVVYGLNSHPYTAQFAEMEWEATQQRAQRVFGGDFSMASTYSDIATGLSQQGTLPELMAKAQAADIVTSHDIKVLRQGIATRAQQGFSFQGKVVPFDPENPAHGEALDAQVHQHGLQYLAEKLTPPAASVKSTYTRDAFPYQEEYWPTIDAIQAIEASRTVDDGTRHEKATGASGVDHHDSGAGVSRDDAGHGEVADLGGEILGSGGHAFQGDSPRNTQSRAAELRHAGALADIQAALEVTRAGKIPVQSESGGAVEVIFNPQEKSQYARLRGRKHGVEWEENGTPYQSHLTRGGRFERRDMLEEHSNLQGGAGEDTPHPLTIQEMNLFAKRKGNTFVGGTYFLIAMADDAAFESDRAVRSAMQDGVTPTSAQFLNEARRHKVKVDSNAVHGILKNFDRTGKEYASLMEEAERQGQGIGSDYDYETSSQAAKDAAKEDKYPYMGGSTEMDPVEWYQRLRDAAPNPLEILLSGVTGKRRTGRIAEGAPRQEKDHSFFTSAGTESLALYQSLTEGSSVSLADVGQMILGNRQHFPEDTTTHPVPVATVGGLLRTQEGSLFGNAEQDSAILRQLLAYGKRFGDSRTIRGKKGSPDRLSTSGVEPQTHAFLLQAAQYAAQTSNALDLTEEKQSQLLRESFARGFDLTLGGKRIVEEMWLSVSRHDDVNLDALTGTSTPKRIQELTKRIRESEDVRQYGSRYWLDINNRHYRK